MTDARPISADSVRSVRPVTGIGQVAPYLVGAFLLLAAVIVLVYAAGEPYGADARLSYWAGAMRIREGVPLYGAYSPDVYLYSPWMAFAWLPLSFLPQSLVIAAWVGFLSACSVLAVLPMSRLYWPLGVFLGACLLRAAWIGNAQPLLVLMLVYGLHRRSGPVWLGIAGSMKVTPLVLAVVYVGRREWGKLAVAVGVTAALWLPALFMGVQNYSVGINTPTMSLLSRSPVLWALLAAGAGLVALYVARTRYAWLAATVALLAALPRMLLYDIGYLAVTPEPRRSVSRS